MTTVNDLCVKLTALLKDLWASDASDTGEDDASRKKQKTDNGRHAVPSTYANFMKVPRNQPVQLYANESVINVSLWQEINTCVLDIETNSYNGLNEHDFHRLTTCLVGIA